MALYRYRAMDAEGKIVRGSLDALNPLDLEMRLKRMSLDLVREKLSRRTARRHGGSSAKRKELINFCFHLEQLLRARVPIVEALVDLRDSLTSVSFREVLANVTEAIEGGKRLSEALAEHPTIFDSVFVSLVRSGEESGQLPEVLEKMTANLKWQDEIAAQTKRLALYPLVTGAIVFAMLFYLMVYLVPKLSQVIRTLQPQQSTGTQMLLAASAFCTEYWYLLLALPLGVYFAVRLMLRGDTRLRRRWDKALLGLPALGPVIQKIILARFATYFSLMYASGIGVLDCLRVCEKIVGNRVVEEGLQQAGRSIADGQSLSNAFARVGLFPPLVLRMLRVGESTGELDRALSNVSYFYNRDISESISSVQQLIQPTMMLVLGLIMILVLLPVFGPIYDAIGNVKF